MGCEQRQVPEQSEDLGERNRVRDEAETAGRGQLLIVEGMDMSFRKLNLRRKANCPLCGDQPTVHGLIDYEAFCGMSAEEPSEATVPVG